MNDSPRSCLIFVIGHRFDILEDLGCYPSIYNTLPAYFLVFMWPVVIGCVSFIYSGELHEYLRATVLILR